MASLLKTGVIYTISNVAVKGVIFMMTPFMARMMTMEQYGEFSNIVSWINILVIIMTFNLYSSINMAKYDFDSEIDDYQKSIFVAGVSITLIFFIILACFYDDISSVINIKPIYLKCILVYILFYPATQILLSKCRMYGEYIKVIQLTWCNSLLMVISSIVFVFFLQDKVLAAVIGNYTIVGIINIVLAIYILKNGKKIRINHIKHSLYLSVPLLPHILSSMIIASSDRIIINNICGASDAALYSIAYTISMVAGVVMSSMNQAWVPWFYDRLSTNSYEDIKRVSIKYTIVFMMFSMMLMLIGPELILFFGGNQYLIAKNIIPYVCIAIIFEFIYTLYVNIEFYCKKTIYISMGTILAGSINVVLNYVFIPEYGYEVGAYTTAISFFVLIIFHMLIVRLSTIYGKIFSIKVITSFLIVSLFMGCITNYLYNIYEVYRYIVFLFFVIIISVISINLYGNNIRRFLKGRYANV